MMNNDAIQKYILKNKDNLRIAATVGEAWPKIRLQIVDGFLDRLKIRLKKKLKGWQFELCDGDFFVTEYPGYYFWKPAWENQYSLCLQLFKKGEQPMLGVGRDKAYIGKRKFSDKLFNAIVSIYPSAQRDAWWEARVKMQSPESDWRKPKVLWRMHKDSKFLDEVAEQLLELEKISGPIIDGLVQKK